MPIYNPKEGSNYFSVFIGCYYVSIIELITFGFVYDKLNLVSVGEKPTPSSCNPILTR